MNYEPTPEEIKANTQQIQAGWSPKEERYRRSGLKAKDLEPNPLPTYDDTVFHNQSMKLNHYDESSTI